jgi:predicted DNA-binding ribbon-helix-helix protein
MKSITIHKIDDVLEERLSQLAQKEGLSLNQLIKKLLRERLELDDNKINHRSDFEEFCGTWSKEDFAEFEAATGEFSKIDEEIWK